MGCLTEGMGSPMCTWESEEHLCRFICLDEFCHAEEIDACLESSIADVPLVHAFR